MARARGLTLWSAHARPSSKSRNEHPKIIYAAQALAQHKGTPYLNGLTSPSDASLVVLGTKRFLTGPTQALGCYHNRSARSVSSRSCVSLDKAE